MGFFRLLSRGWQGENFKSRPTPQLETSYFRRCENQIR